MGKKSRLKQLHKLEKIKAKNKSGGKILKIIVLIILGFLLAAGAYYVWGHQKTETNTAIDHAVEPENDQVAVIETDRGSIYVQLYKSAAPFTVQNFTKLAQEGFYDGTSFHRVVSDFMIQGGDPNSRDEDPGNDGQGGTGEYFPDEINAKSLGLSPETIKDLEDQGYKYDSSRQSVKNTVGAISMANSGPNTNSSQFFIITTKDQPHLDGKHTVFGKVIKGLDIAQQTQQGDVMKKVSLMSISDFKKQFESNTTGVTIEQVPVPGEKSGPSPSITIDTEEKN